MNWIKNMSRLGCSVVLFTVLACPSAIAGIIVSGDGNEHCRMAAGGSASCALQAVSAHPRWQPNDPNGLGAQWVSYADTGYSGSTLAVAPADGDPATPDVQNPLMLVREILVDITAGARLVLDLWADDTAEVQLRFDDGSGFSGGLLTSLLSPLFSQNTCADGPTGCEPEDKAHVEYVFSEQDLAAAAGADVFLHFTTFQVGVGTTNASNPFGLLYSGWTQAMAPAAVPEPSSLGLLFAAGLLGLVMVRRRPQR